MTLRTQDKKAARVLSLFSNVANEYDLLLTLFSMGKDRFWRKRVIKVAGTNGLLLDLATGTGLLSLEFEKLLHENGGLRSVGVDFSSEMLEYARQKIESRRLSNSIQLVRARAENLPFKDSAFDSAAIVLALRNVSDTLGTFQEMLRVVKRGGAIISLDFCRPGNRIFRTVYYAYLFHLMPLLGRIVSKDWENLLRYLGESIRRAFAPAQITRLLVQIELSDVKSVSLTKGVVALIYGKKP